VSTQLEKEVDNVFTSVTPRPLVFDIKLDSGWRGDNITLRPKGKHSHNSDSFIAESVVKNVEYTSDFENGINKPRLERKTYNRIRSEMLSEILSFVFKNCGSQNPRLTSFYKWYKLLDDKYIHLYESIVGMDRIEDMLFSMYKYIKTDCDTSAKKENAIKVLQLIMHKHKDLLERYR
jgi:hypothetical protein